MEEGGYFFLPADCLAATEALFLALALLAADCFWPDFFWFAFGDLSPIVFVFCRWFAGSMKVSPQAVSTMRGGVAEVNGGRQFICPGDSPAGRARDADFGAVND